MNLDFEIEKIFFNNDNTKLRHFKNRIRNLCINFAKSCLIKRINLDEGNYLNSDIDTKIKIDIRNRTIDVILNNITEAEE